MILTFTEQCPNCLAEIKVETDNQAGEKYIKEKKAEIEEFKEAHKKCEEK